MAGVVCGAQAAAPRNLAKGLTATFNKPADYVGSVDEGDAKQLTDGVRCKPNEDFVSQRDRCVAWRGASTIEITFDLGESKLMGGFLLSTVGAGGAGYPKGVCVFASEDGKTWSYAGNLWSKSAIIKGYPNVELPGRWTAESHDMPCRGRYVRFIIAKAKLVFGADEIEIYPGADEARAAACPVVADPAAALHGLEYNTRLMSDALKVGASDRFAARIQRARFAQDVPDARTELPFKGLHTEICAANAARLAAAGFTAPTLWTCEDKWAALDFLAVPPRNAVPATVRPVTLMRGETRATAVNIVNPTSAPLEVTASLEGFPAELGGECREGMITETATLVPVCSALRPGTNGVVSFALPAGVSKQIWISFERPRAKAGVYRGAVKAALSNGETLSAPVVVDLAAVDFPAKPRLHVYGWDFHDEFEYGTWRFKSLKAEAGNRREMDRIFMDVPWGCSDAAPRRGKDGKLDFEKWDRWMARFPEHRTFCLFLGLGGWTGQMRAFGQLDPKLPDFAEKAGAYFREWGEHVAKTTPDRKIIFNVFDEPRNPGTGKALVPWLRAVKCGGPNFANFTDPCFDDMAKEDPEFWELCDVVCPMVMGTFGRNVEFIKSLRAKGKTIWFYQCMGPARLYDPTGYYRMEAWLAAHFGGEGIGYWAFGCGGGIGDSFRAYDQKGTEYSPYCVMPTDAMAAKQSEGIREGVQDYEYLMMLKDRIAARKAAGQDAAALEKLADEATSRALGVEKGAFKLVDSTDWKGGADHERAERVRLDILRALAPARESVKASDFGWNGVDDTAAVQAALDSGAKKIVFDRQPGPWTTQPLFARSNCEIVFEDGAELRAKRGAFRGKRDVLLSLRGVENVTLRGAGAKGGTLRMWKKDYQKPPYEPGEWRHALGLYGAKDVVVENMRFIASGGDGIVLGKVPSDGPRRNWSENVVIRHCVCDDNHRQGISVCAGKNVLIEDTILSNTAGTAPQSGIDFEPDQRYECIADCTMRRCVSENNAGCGYEFYLGQLDHHSFPVGVKIENCVSRGNGYDVLVSSRRPDAAKVKGQLLFTGCRFENARQSSIRAYSKDADTFRVDFENCTISGAGADIADPAKRADVVYLSDTWREAPPDGFGFCGVTIRQRGVHPWFEYRTPCSSPRRTEDFAGEVTVIDGNGRAEKIALDAAWREKTFPVRGTVEIPASRPIMTDDFKKTEILDKAPGEMTAVSEVEVCRRVDYLFYADKPCLVRFEARRLDDSPRTRELHLRSPGGWRYGEVALPGSTNTVCVFKAVERGFYRLYTTDPAVRMVVTKSSHPIALDMRDHAPFLRYVGGRPFTLWADVPDDRAHAVAKYSSANGWQAIVRSQEPGLKAIAFDPAKDVGALLRAEVTGAPAALFLSRDKTWRLR